VTDGFNSTGGKFSIGVNNPSGQFAADWPNRRCISSCYFSRIFKIIEMVPMELSGTQEKIIHEKTLSLQAMDWSV
jgi:hypothetical protein